MHRGCGGVPYDSHRGVAEVRFVEAEIDDVLFGHGCRFDRRRRCGHDDGAWGHDGVIAFEIEAQPDSDRVVFVFYFDRASQGAELRLVGNHEPVRKDEVQTLSELMGKLEYSLCGEDVVVVFDKGGAISIDEISTEAQADRECRRVAQLDVVNDVEHLRELRDVA